MSAIHPTNVTALRDPSELLTAREACDILGIKLATLYTYVSRGLLRPVRHSQRKENRYQRSDVEALKVRSSAHQGHVAMAAHAMRWHMGEAYAGSVDDTVRNWRRGLNLRPAVIALPHPSWRNSGWLKRNTWFSEELLPELRTRVAALLGRAA